MIFARLGSLAFLLGAQAWAGSPTLPGRRRTLARRCTSGCLANQGGTRHTRVLHVSGGGSVDNSEVEEASKATMTQSVFNLVKNIMGAGMLSLPAGVSAFSDARSAILPSSIIIALLGALSAYTFSLIGRCCAETKAESYEQSWARSVAERTSWLPAGACVATCFAGCLAYTIIIGDTFSALLHAAGAPALVARRSTVIGTISAAILLPLALLKNLSALGFTSMLGTSGLLYTAGMMGVRYFDGSYAPGGRFHALLTRDKVPVFGTRSSRPLLFLVLVSMLGTAYEAHFNAPLFFRELKNNTVRRYNAMVASSFAVAVGTMSAVAAFGFLTFGGNSAGYILNNYADADMLATISKVFVGLSIVFSYPLCFVGLRDGLLEMGSITKPKESTRTAWTVGLIGLCSVAAVFLRDLGFVNSFGGALIASAIIYIFPAMMFIAPRKRAGAAGNGKGLEYLANRGVVVVGATMGLLGAIVSVLETFFPALLK